VFAIVVRNEIVRKCETMEQVQNHVHNLVKELAEEPSINPWGHNIDVFVSVAQYTTKQPESWPKEKNCDSEEIMDNFPT